MGTVFCSFERLLITILTAASCAPAATTSTMSFHAPGGPESAAPQLARFMRERVNVPFAFAMMEAATMRPHRMHTAAGLMRDAARHLVHWSNPPAVSDEGRQVFVAYAQSLERHIGRLERASTQRDTDAITDSLERIRQTCNGCHHLFRPASRISRDVLFDRIAVELGGAQ
jgi:hypothetical protein